MVICDAIIKSKNRNDLFVLMDDLAAACAVYTQNNLLSNEIQVEQGGMMYFADSKTETVATTTNPAAPKTASTDIQHREKVNLAEKLGVSKPAPVADNSEKTNRVNDGSPVWLSERVNLSEYWVYDYSNPKPTERGNCGDKCWATELWLVSRRLHKLKLVDAEFDSLDSLQDFLDPRKELAAKNRIEPLEKIDGELAGVNKKDQCDKCRAAKKQSQFSRFLEYYHEFHGDATKIAAAMGVEKQSVYSYKNKAKTMGIIL